MAFSTKLKHRCWMITVHIANMENMNLTKEQYKDPKVLADILIDLWSNSGKNRKAGVAVCVSADGLYHAHVAAYSGNTTTLKAVADIFGRAHTEPQLSGKDTLTAYLKKEGKFAEKGETVLYTTDLDVIEDGQGNRSDLEEIEEMLKKGYTPNEIYEKSFRYRKFEKMIKSAYLQKRINETPLCKEMWNEYHWGASGTGKTYTYIKLCEKYSSDEVYICSDYANSGGSSGGFDFYANNPARIIVLDEFRGNIPYNTLLSMLDVYSRNQQHCRYQNTYNLWTSVYICSVFPPEEVYKHMVGEAYRSIDSMQQFFRRLNKIVYHYRDTKGEYKTFEMFPYEYKNGRDMQLQAAMSDALAVVEDNIKEVKEGDKDEMLRAFGARQIGRLINCGTDTECRTNEDNH